MEELIVWVIGIFLVIGVIGGAFQSVQFWGLPLAMNLTLGLVLALIRRGAMRQPDNLSRVINARWDQTGCNLSWSVNGSVVEKQSLAVPMGFLAVVPGIIYFICQSSDFLNQRMPHQDLQGFFVKAGGSIMALVGTWGSGALTYKMTCRFCNNSVQKTVEQFSAGAEQFRKLQTTEEHVRALSDEVGVNWPPGMSEDISAYIQRERESLLVSGAAFRRRVAGALEQAQSDARMLHEAKERQRETLAAFKDAARGANRAGAVTLVKELEAMHEAMTSESMMSLLIDRKWKEFLEIHQDMTIDLERILRQAEEYAPTGEEAPPISQTTPKESPIERAFRVLGVNGSMSRDAMKKRYRQLAMDYHPDKASQATEAIRALTEEHFKEIQDAWETIKQELHVT
jgi:DnaJ-domain-containing protein 1